MPRGMEGVYCNTIPPAPLTLTHLNDTVKKCEIWGGGGEGYEKGVDLVRDRVLVSNLGKGLNE